MSKILFGVSKYLTTLALILAAGLAQATMIHQTGVSSGQNVANLKLPLQSTASTYFSGLQVLQIDGVSALAFCIDPYQSSPSSATSNYLERNDFSVFFGSRASMVNELYSRFYSSTLPGASGASLNAAGFQLALWELLVDSTFNLSSGNVQITSTTSSNAPVKTAAESMLAALNGGQGSGTFSFRIFTSSTKQDYLLATPVPANQVPEPAALLLLAAALLAMAGLRYRVR